jgi:hypothetical protein
LLINPNGRRVFLDRKCAPTFFKTYATHNDISILPPYPPKWRQRRGKVLLPIHVYGRGGLLDGFYGLPFFTTHIKYSGTTGPPPNPL